MNDLQGKPTEIDLVADGEAIDRLRKQYDEVMEFGLEWMHDEDMRDLFNKLAIYLATDNTD